MAPLRLTWRGDGRPALPLLLAVAATFACGNPADPPISRGDAMIPVRGTDAAATSGPPQVGIADAAARPSPSADSSTTPPTDARATGMDTSVPPSGTHDAAALIPVPRGMGLPGMIPGVEPESCSHHPPVADGKGSLYRITESIKADGNRPRMMKSSNGGAAWVEVDAARRPAVVDLEGTWQLQVGTAIYGSVSRGHEIWWIAFHTSDAPERPDQWVGAEKIDTVTKQSGQKQYSSLVRTSDGRFWIFYSDAIEDGRFQLAYRQRTGAGAYGAKAKLDVSSGSFTAPRSLLGRNDTANVFYKDHGQHRLLWRKLRPDGALSEAIRLDAGGTSKVTIPHTNAVTFERDGKEIVMLAYAAPDGALKLVTITDGVVGAEETVSSAAVLQNPPIVLNEGAVAHLALDGRTVHVVWADAASGDLKHRARPDGGSWTAEKIVWASGAQGALYVYCNVISSGGRKRLGYTYDVGPHEDDTGVIRYDEIDLQGP